MYLFLAGLLGNGIPAFLFATAQTRIDSSLAGILNATAPIFTLIVGWMFFSLAFKRSAAMGIIIGLAGTIYLLVFNKPELSNRRHFMSNYCFYEGNPDLEIV